MVFIRGNRHNGAVSTFNIILSAILEEINIVGKRGFDELNEEKTFDKLNDILKDIKERLRRDLADKDSPLTKFYRRKGDLVITLQIKSK